MLMAGYDRHAPEDNPGYGLAPLAQNIVIQ